MRVSVVIPTWCERSLIGPAVERARRWADEVVVADGGSPDGTAEEAARAGARVVCAAKGRGAQLQVGAAAARGDVLLFLHADVWLPPQGRVALERALENPRVAGGNFRLRFVPASAWAQVFSAANDLRRRWMRIYYGDSGIFVRRRVYDELGGFRRLPILEDYEFVRRLERFGPTAYIHDPEVRASGRRFRRRPLRTLGRWIVVQTLYLIGVPPVRLARLYPDAR